MVIFAEMHDRVKKEEPFVVDIMKAALDTGNKDPCFPDSSGIQRKEQKYEFNEIFQERQSVDKVVESNAFGMDEDPLSKKRKRQCFSSTLNWLRSHAKKPFDLDMGPLPETSKWKHGGGDLPWKQILSIRETLRKKADPPQPSVLQKKQRMHPSMYEDNQYSNDRIRCSRRILAAKDSFHKGQDHSPKSPFSESFEDESSEEKQLDDPWFVNHRRKRPRIGSLFQATLPEPCGEYSGDPKWLGTKVWPLEKTENKRFIIEIEPIGKGRPEHCGCEFPGDPHCVRFHITEKRIKKMLELRSAFYSWKLDYMGENVALSWTREDQQKFQDTVETNRLSSDKYFWDELFKCFPGKGREALVSYYFNVFLLRRRSEQNRSMTGHIYSDDEESELGPIADRFGQSTANSRDSIFCSPKKTSSAHPSSR